MAMLVVRNLTHSFGGPPTLDNVALRVEQGDRVCLFGRNGEGKSTLMRIMAGELRPDAGSVDVTKGRTVAMLEQTVPPPTEMTVREVVTEQLGAMRDVIARYFTAIDAVAAAPDDARVLAELTHASAAMDAANAWSAQQRVEIALSSLSLTADEPFGNLSGGWRRRVALAAVLAKQPDVLLLDEPTNHLDIDAIEWLEDLLLRFEGAIVFVTHDRSFLRRVATRIVEIDRGQLAEFPADFDDYLDAKADALRIEESHDAQFDKVLAEEEAWIRTGIKARRTRNEGRVRALERLREQRKARRKRKSQASIVVFDAGRSGEMVVETENLGFAWEGGAPIIDGLNVRIRRGDRLGLIGPNGVGKTTLLRLLMGDLTPSTGTVRHGTRLQVRYYDQLRGALDETVSLSKTIAPDSDHVMVNEKPVHVASYLTSFLFRGDQLNAPVSVLSGGERNRLLLAKLFAEPANVLVLDEPTNDLDIETLQVLEEQLLGFGGAIILVSHDREFLDNVATQSLVFEGDGVITPVVGGYDEWHRLRQARQPAVVTPTSASKSERAAAAPITRKLTYAEELELAALPDKIEAAEAHHEAVSAKLSDPAISADHVQLAAVAAELEAAEKALNALYDRWAQLEE